MCCPTIMYDVCCAAAGATYGELCAHLVGIRPARLDLNIVLTIFTSAMITIITC